MLDSKYRIDQLLAVGGMGAVYIGTHTKLRKRVAIKVLNPQISSPLMVERFHREAVTASQIGHEGIAQVTDLGTSRDGEPFLVMELLDGESLAARIKMTGAMPIDVACRIAVAILSPLEAAHRAGIVHRDLKPDNVFLVRQSRSEMIKLLDFGIARAADLDAEFRLTTTGLVLGTPYYMSPEQARGENEVTHLADIYAVGVILYEMVCGQVPIQGENYNQLMFKVMSGDYRPPRALRPDLPRELEQIILTSIALEPHARPRSAAALEQALLPFCGTGFTDHQLERATPSFRPAAQPITAATIPNVPNRAAVAATPVARNRRWFAIAGFAIASVIGGVAVVVATTKRPTGSTEATTSMAEVHVVPTLPAETKPEQTEPVQANPVGSQPIEPTPVATTPGAAQSAETKPSPVEPVEAGSNAVAPAPPAKPATIRLRFSVVPTFARVYLDGRRVASDELEVTQDQASHTVRITAPGYAPYEATVKFDETQKLAIELSRISKATRATKSSGASDKRGTDKIESQSPYD